MNRSTPGLPVHHQLLEFTQTHSHRVSDAIQPSHPLSSPSLPAFPFSSCLQSFPESGSFPMSQFFASSGQSIGRFSISLTNEYSGLISFRIDWFDLAFPRHSQESSPTPHFKSTDSLALSLLYGPTLTSVHDYWKNQNVDYVDLYWQSDVSAF